MQEDKKTIIVGGGLSGLSLAFQLDKNNVPFELITKKENHSSLIAAGLINPIVFRRTTKSWEVDNFLRYARTFYSEVEQTLSIQLWNDLKIRRSFSHEQEREDWMRKKKIENYKDYLGEIDAPSPSNLYQEYGTGVVEQGAWIDTHQFIGGLRDYFEKKGVLKYGDLSTFYSEEALKNDFNSVVFCEGYELIHNPYFNYLPLDPTKGQTLHIHSLEIPENESINRKCFILPIGGNEFKVGATYEWSDSSLNITDEGRAHLVNDIENLIKADFKIIDQQAGVRPTVKDRRPLLGQHPEIKNFYVFNGLGTKGYLIGPYMAREMYAYLFENKDLMKEVNIDRYNKTTNN